MSNTILVKLKEAIRTKNASWIPEIQKDIMAIVDDIERKRQSNE